MALSTPVFQRAHAVFQLSSFSRDVAKDEAFIQGVKEEFPNVISRQQLPAEALGPVPHLVLASTSSQLALSALQVDFEVRFYGDYLGDIPRGVEYVERKLAAVLKGLEAAEMRPTVLGLVGSLKFPFIDTDETPAAHVASVLLKPDVEQGSLQDAMARIAIRVRDTYFVTLTVSNYETRHFQRPVFTGMTALAIRPWEGDVDEVGVELLIDVNNLLEAREREEEPTVTPVGLGVISRLFREIATTTGPAFAESGTLSVDDITAVSR